MSISIEQVQGYVPVTILSVQGALDASNYRDVIEAAQETYDQGARDILIDMTDIHFMSSSGIVALHSIALMLRGEQTPDPESGWDALHSVDRDRDSGVQEHIKLLNPQTQVDKSLELTGLKKYFAIFKDRDIAVASFR